MTNLDIFFINAGGVTIVVSLVLVIFKFYAKRVDNAMSKDEFKQESKSINEILEERHRNNRMDIQRIEKLIEGAANRQTQETNKLFKKFEETEKTINVFKDQFNRYILEKEKQDNDFKIKTTERLSVLEGKTL